MTKSFFKNKNLRELVAFILLIGAAVAVSLSGNSQRAVKDGIALWAATVLPALFPYLFITSLLSSLNITGKIACAASPFTEKAFGVNGHCGYALFLSLTCGYPVGAKCVSDLKLRGLIGDAESVRAAALCSSSSPVFLIASVGNLTFNSPLFGLLLYLTHFLSVLIVGVVFSFYKRDEKPAAVIPASLSSSDNPLYDGAYSAVISVLVVGGIITIFYLLTEMLGGVGIMRILNGFFGLFTDDAAICDGLSNGLFECTKGLKLLARGGVSPFALPVAAAICGAGGLSVIMQSLAYLNRAKIKTAPFLLSKTLAAVVNFIFGLIISRIFLA